MTEAQKEIYAKTVRRLARMGVTDPTAQIIALAEEIEQYRERLQVSEKGAKRKRRPRYTSYDPGLGRYVVPCGQYAPEGERVEIFVKILPEDRTTEGLLLAHEVHLVYGEAIDRLAELEAVAEQYEGPMGNTDEKTLVDLFVDLIDKRIKEAKR